MFETSARSTYASSGVWNEVPEPPAFLEKAACKRKRPRIFYPERGDGAPVEALSICSLCVVKKDCLEYALEHREPYGIWGGKTERQRKAMLKRSGVKAIVRPQRASMVPAATGKACRRGHPVNASNSSFVSGRWYCLVCRRANAAERREREGGQVGED